MAGFGDSESFGLAAGYGKPTGYGTPAGFTPHTIFTAPTTVAVNPIAGFPNPAMLTGEVNRIYLTTGVADDHSNFIFGRAPRSGSQVTGSVAQETSQFINADTRFNGIRIINGGGFTNGILRIHCDAGTRDYFEDDADNFDTLSVFIYYGTNVLEHAFENLDNSGGGFVNFSAADNTVAAQHTALRPGDLKITMIIADRVND